MNPAGDHTFGQEMPDSIAPLPLISIVPRGSQSNSSTISS
jgi:hypothetical protein